MSSVVKKGSHFTPKLKKNPVRRKNQLATPPTTQVGAEPASTERPSFRPSLETTSGPETPTNKADEEDVDPKDTTKRVEDEDYGDNDIFKTGAGLGDHITVHRRNSLVRSHRRLSGITPLKPRLASIVSIGLAQEEEPMKIGIPLSRPVKRRRSSVRKKSSFSIPTPAAVLREDREVRSVAEEHEDELSDENDDLEFVVGVDPETNKLRKFRRRPAEEDDDDDIPLAPENLKRRITSIEQVPKSIEERDLELYTKVKISNDLKMADLCKPNLAIGGLSEHYEKAREAQRIIDERKIRRREARLKARTERILFEEALRLGETDQERTEQKLKLEKKQQAAQDVFKDEPEKKSGIQLNVVGGKLEVNQDSTVQKRDLALTQRGDEAEEENPFADPVTSITYSKRRHTDKWTSDEMVVFYNAISTWGTDFTFIAQLFPYRTRKQIKAKFVLEEKRFPEIVELALKRRLPPDFEKYCQDSKSTIHTMEHYEEELRRLREEHQDHIEQINQEKEKAIQDDLEASRKREIEIRTGSKPMTKAQRQKELRKNEQVVGTLDEVKRER